MSLSSFVTTVLIVDDSAAIRRELIEEFTRHGVSLCIEAENGRQGIERARECQPDLIILDLSMPVMNGLDAAPKLRKLLPNSPIILYTLFADTLRQSDLETLGITMVLPKNTSMDSLVEKAAELF